jgi:hypothetical protein
MIQSLKWLASGWMSGFLVLGREMNFFLRHLQSESGAPPAFCKHDKYTYRFYIKVFVHQRQELSCWPVPITRIKMAPSFSPSDNSSIFGLVCAD